MDTPGKWHFELVTNDMMVLYRIKDVVHTGKTSYQDVDILDTETFGRCLVLDGKTQSTEVDEHVYHEALVHPSLLLHGGPGSVFIGGGGEGATLREVLAHRSVERVTMVDLDAEVVDLCRRFLPRHHRGTFDDPRVDLRHADAREYLASTADTYDVIVLDLVDPLEGGTSYLLYTREFYEIAKSKLKPGGVLVTQAGPAGLLNYGECFTAVARTLSAVFPRTYPYGIYIPAFTTLWGMVTAFADSPSASPTPSPQDPDPGHIDRLIGERMATEPRYYDGLTHRSMFALPKYLRRSIAEEQRLVTDREPVFMI
ncbi:MAG: fused MFS/spermidine synthase [Dehalococcoidia bacterium]|nr:fused MFS/spermidine synthase [Dehalococcoidia bacterium]